MRTELKLHEASIAGQFAVRTVQTVQADRPAARWHANVRERLDADEALNGAAIPPDGRGRHSDRSWC